MSEAGVYRSKFSDLRAKITAAGGGWVMVCERGAGATKTERRASHAVSVAFRDRIVRTTQCVGGKSVKVRRPFEVRSKTRDGVLRIEARYTGGDKPEAAS